MDRYRIYGATTVKAAVLVLGRPTFEDVQVPGAVVKVNGVEVIGDPTIEKRQVFVDVETDGLLIEEGEMPSNGMIKYAGKEHVHSIVAVTESPDTENKTPKDEPDPVFHTVTGKMTVSRDGPFTVAFVPDPDPE